jgi:DNA-binding MarR family transcriptional regulator
MRHNRGAVVLAHIGNIPVEEWLPFVAPVVVLYLLGRRMTRNREREVAQVMAKELLDERTVGEILERWRQRRPNELSSKHVPIFWPPGPEASTPGELAARLGIDLARVEPLLDELEELGYLERDGGDGTLWLTIEGYDLMNDAESVLLEHSRAREDARARAEAKADREAWEQQDAARAAEEEARISEEARARVG